MHEPNISRSHVTSAALVLMLAALHYNAAAFGTLKG